MSFLAELAHITKDFPGTRALDGVSFTVRPGEIHALIGENGAGKSTLIKVLGGVWHHASFSGALRIDGRERRFATTRDAESAGIAVIYQELALVPEMTVAENICLGREATRLGLLDEPAMAARSISLLDELGVELHPQQRVASLGVGQQQMVEIAKALSRDFRLLVLDEPTSSLSETEAQALHGLLRSLRSRGVGMVYISHRLREVLGLADRITVLRDGRTVGTVRPRETDEEELVRMMVGRDVARRFAHGPCARGRPVMQVRNLTVEHPSLPGKKLLDSVDLALHEGEVLGIAGLVGAGRTELLEALFGLAPGRWTGEIRIGEAAADISSPSDAVARGVVLLSEDRKQTGLVLEQSVRVNTTLPGLRRFCTLGWIHGESESVAAEHHCGLVRVRMPTVEAPVSALSGGNQQKVALGKWLLLEPRVLLLDEPTRGIDVGAKAEIYGLIRDLAAAGCAIALVSSELEETIGLSDRIMTLCDGRCTGEFQAGAVDQRTLMAAMTATHAAA